ncbi:head fiber protein [Staphylococcus haemolyticus]|uniref:head fiber protein n=1 Tax=Staphylococcus haemolyticus TaxID=1283 RepID=UPI001E55FAE9|nr:head fiber protein [Staphylococcus haemolyticus]MCC3722174.1 hypothetical protein [Staphylococcus haemolyticus]
MATSGVAGLLYATKLIDLGTGQSISVADIISGSGGGGSVAWADITGKPATFPPVIGTTATTAKAGDYVPAWSEITSKPTTFAPVPATASVVGGVKAAATQAASTATDVAGLVTDFNALLTKLKAAGIML